MKHIHNPEVFTIRGQFVLQWIERTDDNRWLRRQGRITQTVASKLQRMDVYEQLEWIARRLPEPVEPEQPEDVKHGRHGDVR